MPELLNGLEILMSVATIFTFETDDGDVVIWNTQTKKDIKENHRYMITGTVKSHGVYKNVQQTVFTRIKIEEELGEFI